MTKRISAVILTLMLAMTLLAGCGGDKTQVKMIRKQLRIMKIIKIMELHLRQKMQENIILQC